MSGPLPYDLDKGFFWGAAIEIIAIQLTRKKVIFEVYGESGDPELSLFLDANDFMVFQAKDREGKLSQTKPVNPIAFAFRRGFLFAEAFPTKGKKGQLTLRLTMEGAFTETATAQGKFGGAVEHGMHAFGADRNSDNPATFKVYELIVLERAPLSAQDYKTLAAHMRTFDEASHG